LGPTAPADDPVIAEQAAAADAYIQSQRAAAGWSDDPATVPGPDVHEACLLYAVSLYRQRAAADGLPSFAEFDTPAPPASVLPRVKALARFPRPVVA
jgi:hypothetical protein